MTKLNPNFLSLLTVEIALFRLIGSPGFLQVLKHIWKAGSKGYLSMYVVSCPSRKAVMLFIWNELLRISRLYGD
jgi:hypothetical protein